MNSRERIEKDYQGIVEVFNKEYSKKKNVIESNSAKILQTHILSVIKRMKKLEKNRWFKFKVKRNLQIMYIKIEYAEKWEFY